MTGRKRARVSDVIIFVVNVVAAAVAEDGEKEFGRDGCVCGGGGASQLSFVSLARSPTLRPDRRRSLIVPSPLPILTVTAVEALYLPVPSLRWMQGRSILVVDGKYKL